MTFCILIVKFVEREASIFRCFKMQSCLGLLSQ
jgi:hypothetical protein